MELAPKVENALWDLFDNAKYLKVKHYILKWHRSEEDGFNSWENFRVYYQGGLDQKIDLAETLYNMPNDILIRIAIDLGIDTPALLPSVPQFKNILKDKNENAHQTFDRAIKNVFDHPDEAVSLANSALEGVIKSILSDDTFKGVSYNPKATLYDLTQVVLKQFKAFPDKDHELEEVSRIGSGLMTASQNIETLRSTKTKSHGKAKDDYIITDPLWAHFVVNSVATIGLFITQYFETKYKPAVQELNKPEPKEVSLDEIPF